MPLLVFLMHSTSAFWELKKKKKIEILTCWSKTKGEMQQILGELRPGSIRRIQEPQERKVMPVAKRMKPVTKGR